MKEFHICHENPDYSILFAVHQHQLPTISYISYSFLTHISSTQHLVFLSEMSFLLLLAYIFFRNSSKFKILNSCDRVNWHDL